MLENNGFALGNLLSHILFCWSQSKGTFSYSVLVAGYVQKVDHATVSSYVVASVKPYLAKCNKTLCGNICVAVQIQGDIFVLAGSLTLLS